MSKSLERSVNVTTAKYFGQGKADCHARTKCGNSGLSLETIGCTQPKRCTNCRGDHSSDDPSCPEVSTLSSKEN